MIPSSLPLLLKIMFGEGHVGRIPPELLRIDVCEALVHGPTIECDIRNLFFSFPVYAEALNLEGYLASAQPGYIVRSREDRSD